MISFKIIEHNSGAWREAVALRENVLRKPLGQTFHDWELEEEAKHVHVAGYDGSTIVATAVLVPSNEEMKMQRVAVLEQERNQNFGSKMMDFCEQIAKEKGCKSMYCHARDSAVQFYKKNDWQIEGDYFDEDGIPHVKIRKEV